MSGWVPSQVGKPCGCLKAGLHVFYLWLVPNVRKELKVGVQSNQIQNERCAGLECA